MLIPQSDDHLSSIEKNRDNMILVPSLCMTVKEDNIRGKFFVVPDDPLYVVSWKGNLNIGRFLTLHFRVEKRLNLVL